jgi:hypothetical protein
MIASGIRVRSVFTQDYRPGAFSAVPFDKLRAGSTGLSLSGDGDTKGRTYPAAKAVSSVWLYGTTEAVPFVESFPLPVKPCTFVQKLSSLKAYAWRLEKRTSAKAVSSVWLLRHD